MEYRVLFLTKNEHVDKSLGNMFLSLGNEIFYSVSLVTDALKTNVDLSLFHIIVLSETLTNHECIALSKKIRNSTNMIFRVAQMEEDTEIEANFLNPAISLVDLREFLSEQSGLISEGAHTNLSPRTFLFKSLEFKSSLSKTERKLLTELEKHPNTYISREQLALLVWGSVGMDDTKIESRMAQLSQLVRRIQEKWTKQKLEPEELIQIKWKKGYKLVQPIPEK